MADTNTTTGSTAGYWVTATIVVVALAVAAWWYTTLDTTSLVPNTGSTASSTLEYVAD
jgi:hypothetical protein